MCLVAVCQRVGLGPRAVDKHQPARPCRQQRPQRACARAARAYQQHVAPGQGDAGIVLDVVHQAHAVGVVGMDDAAVQLERVGSPGQLRAVGQCGRSLKGFELERHGDIAAAGAVCASCASVAAKASSGTSRRSYCSDWSVNSAKRAWISGDLLCAIGLPRT
jgi:hypothetical protein